MTSGSYPVLLWLVLFGLAGCESSMPVQVSGDDKFVSRVREQAIKLEESGDLTRAVYQWQVVVGMRANDPQAKAELKRLRKIIRAKIVRLESDFEQARTDDNNKRRRMLALKLLVLDGKHSAARDYLQDYEHQSALVMQSQKDREALEAQASRLEKARQKLLAIKQNEHDEMIRLRTKADKAAIIELANARKGDDLYRAGIKALSVDLDEAIALLAESLVYNPDNTQAKQHIQRAIKMQNTLRKIEQIKSVN